MPLHSLAQVERVGQTIIGDLPARREVRDDVRGTRLEPDELRVDVVGDAVIVQGGLELGVEPVDVAAVADPYSPLLGEHCRRRSQDGGHEEYPRQRNEPWCSASVAHLPYLPRSVEVRVRLPVSTLGVHQLHAPATWVTQVGVGTPGAGDLVR